MSGEQWDWIQGQRETQESNFYYFGPYNSMEEHAKQSNEIMISFPKENLIWNLDTITNICAKKYIRQNMPCIELICAKDWMTRPSF